MKETNEENINWWIKSNEKIFNYTINTINNEIIEDVYNNIIYNSISLHSAPNLNKGTLNNVINNDNSYIDFISHNHIISFELSSSISLINSLLNNNGATSGNNFNFNSNNLKNLNLSEDKIISNYN